MSVDISVSSNKNVGCREMIDKLRKSNINARSIETISVIDGEVERGCLITVGKEYIDKDNLSDLWRLIGSDYQCSHININGIFNGCIYNYISKDFCPGE